MCLCILRHGAWPPMRAMQEQKPFATQGVQASFVTSVLLQILRSWPHYGDKCRVFVEGCRTYADFRLTCGTVGNFLWAKKKNYKKDSRNRAIPAFILWARKINYIPLAHKLIIMSANKTSAVIICGYALAREGKWTLWNDLHLCMNIS